MTEFNPCSELSPPQPIYPTQADTTEVFTKDISVAGVGTYPVIQNAPYNGRISSITVIAGAGSGVFTVKIGTVNVTGLVGKVINSSELTYTPTDLNIFNVDEDIVLSITSATDLSNVAVSISILREVGTATVTSTTPDSGVSAAFTERISAAFPMGFQVVDIPFGTTKLDENDNPTNQYVVLAEPPENVVDAVPDRIFPTLIERTPTGIKLLLSAIPTTSNTIFRATISTAASATAIVSLAGGSASIPTTSLPLRGDGAGGAIAITQQTGDVAAGLETQNLFTSGTYDATKLTGNIPTARLNAGTNANSGTFWRGDEQWAVPPGSGTSVATDSIFDAKGDLVVGTSANTAVKLPVGSPDTLLVSTGPLTAQGMGWSKVGSASFLPAYIDGTSGTASLRTLGTGAQQAAPGNDPRILGALQASNNLSDLDDPSAAALALGFGNIVYENSPANVIVGDVAVQTLINKTMDGDLNTFMDIPVAAIAGSATSTLTLSPPGVDSLPFWDHSALTFDWAKLTGPGYTVTGTTPNQQFNVISQINSQITAYTTILSDAEKTIYHPVSDDNARTFTIDSNANVAYTIGTKINFINDKNTLTIAITSDVMVLSGGTSTGSRTLATTGNATAQKVTATRWIIWGTNLT